MVSLEEFRTLALSFPDTSEIPHFHIPSFRYKNKIYATLWEKENKAMLKLPLPDQSVFCSYNSSVFYPVPGSWGLKGATFVNLEKVNKKIIKEAIGIAYKTLNPKK